MRRVSGLALALALVPALTQADPPPPPNVSAMLCQSAPASGETKPVVELLSGFGEQRWSVRTTSAKAQAFFDNGLQLGQAFAHGEALVAFEEAARQDPNCAMCLWGQAWAGGPTLNFGADQKTRDKWAALMVRATVLAKDGPELEKGLVAAMTRRYAADGGALAYGDAMEAMAKAHPDDDQLAVLAADALMIAFSSAGHKDALPRAIALMEPVLKRQPKHAGAIHFYIHATEMHEETAKAEAYADTLPAAAPKAGHLLHMPSHTYYWVGRYKDAYVANAAAARADAERAKAKGLTGPDAIFQIDYHGHNVQFGAAGALMSGDGAGALDITRDLLTWGQSGGARDAYRQRIVGSAYAAQGRHGDIDQVLAAPEPAKDRPLLRAFHHYARGEALARRGDADGVRREIRSTRLRASQLSMFGGGASSAAALTEVAALVLEGRAAMLDNDPKAAIKAYRKAADLEEARFGKYGDPPSWWYPVRRSLAAAQLASGDAAGAAESARAAIGRRPKDPIALYVLSQAERAQGEAQAADASLALARKGWVGDLAKVTPADV